MSSESSKLSFAKVAGAGASAPVAATDANAQLVDPAKTGVAPVPGSQAPAVVPPAKIVPRFSLGDEEEGDDSDSGEIIGKVRRPYLNLVQPSSKADMKAIAPEGSFVLNKSIKIPAGNRAVVVGFGPTFFREKTKFNSDVQGRTAYSLEEVAKYGGTHRWDDSKENDKSDSRKPWFQPSILAILLIECPAGADDAFFPHVINGKAYAAVCYEAKATNYDSFYLELVSKRKTTALFKGGGYPTRFIELQTGRSGKKADASFKVLPVVKEQTGPEFLTLATQIASEASA